MDAEATLMEILRVATQGFLLEINSKTHLETGAKFSFEPVPMTT
jgi:hypothetical protein